MNVLILSSNNGGGHNAAAHAIAECFAAHGHHCEIRDCLFFVSERVSRTVARSHTLVYQRAPKLFGRSYMRTERCKSTFRRHHRARLLIDSGRFKLRQYIRQEGFGIVICTHVFSAMMLTAAKEGGGLSVKTALVETDYTNTPGTADSDLDMYFVPYPTLAAGLMAGGVSEERIVPSGIPIRQAMLNNCGQAEAKERLGLDPTHPHILLMGGSMGCGPLEDLADILYLFLADDVEITVVCGTNAVLLERLQEQLGHADNFHLLGYTQHMSLLMDSATLLVTKPGGLTISEAAVKGLPLVLMDTVAGCEAHNLRFFTERGGAVSGNTPEEVFRLCEKLLQDEDKRRSMSQALIAMSHPDAAEMIYESVLRLIP